jgi:transporter family-2 protein
MQRWTLLVLSCLGGVGLALQPAWNARLRTAVDSPVLAALVSFLVGGAVLAIVTASGVLGRGRFNTLGEVPWWGWLGGVLGAFYVTAAVVSLPRLGSTLVLAATLLGQLATALVIDANGWYGVPKVPLSPTRMAGVVLLLLGVALLQRR